MVGYREVVRVTAKTRLQSNVTANLAGDLVIAPPEQSDEFVTGKITR
jgi:hypothetical protein